MTRVEIRTTRKQTKITYILKQNTKHKKHRTIHRVFRNCFTNLSLTLIICPQYPHTHTRLYHISVSFVQFHPYNNENLSVDFVFIPLLSVSLYLFFFGYNISHFKERHIRHYLTKPFLILSFVRTPLPGGVEAMFVIFDLFDSFYLLFGFKRFSDESTNTPTYIH